MSEWNPAPLAQDVPLYVALADALARDLEAKRLRPGDRLPTHRSLARRLGINVMTVTRGYAEAARRGLVEGESGRGTFVRGQGLPANEFMTLSGSGRRQVDFHFNLPAGDPSVLDVEGALAELAQGLARAALFTGYAALGLDAHREMGAAWIARSGAGEVDASRVVVTGGAQHAMTLALLSRTTPGDVILAEELTYPGILGLATALHLRAVGVPMDREGVLPDALEAACRRHEPGALYLMPNLHNPRGTSTGLARREEIVAVARRRGLPILEDDTYGFLIDAPPAPFASLAPELTLHVAGTSKSLAAGLRLGFLLAPEGERPEDRIAPYVAATSWMAAPLLAELARRWIESGAADRMIAWKRFEARARRELADAALGGERLDAARSSSHVWLPLPEPWRAAEFAESARQRGVLLTPAESFVVGRGAAPPAVRICLGTPGARDEVARGLAILAEVLGREPRPGRVMV